MSNPEKSIEAMREENAAARASMDRRRPLEEGMRGLNHTLAQLELLDGEARTAAIRSLFEGIPEDQIQAAMDLLQKGMESKKEV